MELSRNTNHRRKKSETRTTACHSNTALRKCSMDSCLILRCLSFIRASIRSICGVLRPLRLLIPYLLCSLTCERWFSLEELDRCIAA